MSNDLSTEMMVEIQRRTAAREGVPMVVVKRGYGSVGTLMLKINRLDGTARVLSQVRYDDELVWSPMGKSDPMPDRDADTYVTRQGEIDPDLWIIEIEDKQGRHWFPGKVIS